MNIEFNSITLPRQPPEFYYGNKEYKISLNINKIKNIKKKKNKILNEKASQMLFRIVEGNGKAVYLIGVSDNGESKGIELKEIYISLFYLEKISQIIDAKIKKIRIYKGTHGYISTIRLEKKYDFNFL